MGKLKVLIKPLKGILISSGRRPLCILLCSVILWIISFYDPPDITDTGPADGDRVNLIGAVESMVITPSKYEMTVSDVVTKKGEKYCNRLKLYSSNNNDSKQEVKPLPPLKIGNTISFSGTVKSFRKPGNPGQFNEVSYYLALGIDARCFVSDVSVVSDDYDSISNALYEIRGLFRDAFYSLLPEKEAGIITAMVLGEKQGLDEDINELYRENGIAHILAISGLHISMIGVGLFWLLRKTVFSLKVSAVMTGMILFLYGQLTGFPLATRRAFAMTLILLVAKIIGERFDRLNALSASAIIELIIHPESIFQSGFLLSYGTVLGISIFVSEFEMIRIGDEKSLRQAVFNIISGSLGVSLVTLPIIVQSYHEVPVYSVIVNTLLLPMMSLMLGMSLFGGGVFVIGMFAARFVFGIVYYILQAYQIVCEVVSSLPMSSIIVSHRSTISIVIYYLVLVIVSKRTKDDFKSFSVRMISAIILINVIIFLQPASHPGLTITNIDVGQGDCACIRYDDKVILIDGGSSDVKEVAKYRIVPCLKFMGIDTIDYMIITHSDADHVNGFAEMLTKHDHFGIDIKNVVMPLITGVDKAYKEFEEKASKAGIERLIKISAGDRIDITDMELMCLHPSKGYAWEDANDYSTVLRLQYGSFTGLFTGDLGFHGEEAIDGLLTDVNYLKVGHHGSKGSSSGTFLQRVRPEIAVASAGYKNRYHHPAKEAVERLENSGAKIYCTIDCGAVTTWTDGECIRVEKHLANS